MMVRGLYLPSNSHQCPALARTVKKHLQAQQAAPYSDCVKVNRSRQCESMTYDRRTGISVGAIQLREALFACGSRCGACLDSSRHLGVDIEHLIESRDLQWVCDRSVVGHDER